MTASEGAEEEASYMAKDAEEQAWADLLQETAEAWAKYAGVQRTPCGRRRTLYGDLLAELEREDQLAEAMARRWNGGERPWTQR